MLPVRLYFTLLALCWLYALFKGGESERAGTTLMVVGSALTWVMDAGSVNRFGSLETGILVVDVATFLAFVVLALRADRFWPIWVSALAGLGVLGHLARSYPGAELTSQAYVVSIVLWSYPILALLAVGTMNHQRRAVPRLARSRGRGQVGR